MGHARRHCPKWRKKVATKQEAKKEEQLEQLERKLKIAVRKNKREKAERAAGKKLSEAKDAEIARALAEEGAPQETRRTNPRARRRQDKATPKPSRS